MRKTEKQLKAIEDKAWKDYLKWRKKMKK